MPPGGAASLRYITMRTRTYLREVDARRASSPTVSRLRPMKTANTYRAMSLPPPEPEPVRGIPTDTGLGITVAWTIVVAVGRAIVATGARVGTRVGTVVATAVASAVGVVTAAVGETSTVGLVAAVVGETSAVGLAAAAVGETSTVGVAGAVVAVDGTEVGLAGTEVSVGAGGTGVLVAGGAVGCACVTTQKYTTEVWLLEAPCTVRAHLPGNW
jgi:hypothetical protein